MDKDNSKKAWDTIIEAIVKRKNPKIININKHGISDKNIIANSFNDYFVNAE